MEKKLLKSFSEAQTEGGLKPEFNSVIYRLNGLIERVEGIVVETNGEKLSVIWDRDGKAKDHLPTEERYKECRMPEFDLIIKHKFELKDEQ